MHVRWGGGLTLPKTMNEKNVHVDDSIATHILLIMIVLIAKLVFVLLVCMFLILYLEIFKCDADKRNEELKLQNV